MSGCSSIAAFIFPAILTSLPVPAAEKHSHSMMLPPPCFTVGMVLTWWWVVPSFLQTWHLAFTPKSSLSHQTREFCFSWSESPSGAFWPYWWIAAEMVVLLEGSPLSTEEGWSSDRVTIGFLVTSLTKALLPRSLSLDGRPALGRVLVVPNFFHLRMMEATVLIGTIKAKHFSVHFPRFVPQDNTVSEVDRQFLWLHTWFVLWHALCVPFQIMSNQLNLPQVDSN